MNYQKPASQIQLHFSKVIFITKYIYIYVFLVVYLCSLRCARILKYCYFLNNLCIVVVTMTHVLIVYCWLIR